MRNLFNDHNNKLTILACKLLSDVSEVYNFRIETRRVVIQSYLNSKLLAFCHKRKFKVEVNYYGNIICSKQIGHTTIEIIITD